MSEQETKTEVNVEQTRQEITGLKAKLFDIIVAKEQNTVTLNNLLKELQIKQEKLTQVK